MKGNKEKIQSLFHNKDRIKKESNTFSSSFMEISKNIGNNRMKEFLEELQGSTKDIEENFTKKSEVMKEYEPDKKEEMKKGKLEKISHLSMDTGDISVAKFKEKDEVAIVPFMKNARFRTANFKDMKRVKGVSARKRNFKSTTYLSNPNGSKESASGIMTSSNKNPSKLISNIEKAIQNEDLCKDNKLLEEVFPFLTDKKEGEMLEYLKENRKQIIHRQETLQKLKKNTNSATLGEQNKLEEELKLIDNKIQKLKEIIEWKRRKKRKLLTRLLSIQLKVKMMRKTGQDLDKKTYRNILQENDEDSLEKDMSRDEQETESV